MVVCTAMKRGFEWFWSCFCTWYEYASNLSYQIYLPYLWRQVYQSLDSQSQFVGAPTCPMPQAWDFRGQKKPPPNPKNILPATKAPNLLPITVCTTVILVDHLQQRSCHPILPWAPGLAPACWPDGSPQVGFGCGSSKLKGGCKGGVTSRVGRKISVNKWLERHINPYEFGRFQPCVPQWAAAGTEEISEALLIRFDGCDLLWKPSDDSPY